MTDSDFAYIAREPECGCVTVAMVDRPEAQKDNAREIAACVRDGMAIERTTVGEARPLIASCPHWKWVKRKRVRTDAPLEARP